MKTWPTLGVQGQYAKVGRNTSAWACASAYVSTLLALLVTGEHKEAEAHHVKLQKQRAGTEQQFIEAEAYHVSERTIACSIPSKDVVPRLPTAQTTPNAEMQLFPFIMFW